MAEDHRADLYCTEDFKLGSAPYVRRTIRRSAQRQLGHVNTRAK